MKVFTPDLCFKGNRQYVHGTTLYEEILKGAAARAGGAPDGPLRMEFRGQLLHQGIIYFYPEDELAELPKERTANFNLTCGDKVLAGWVADAGKKVKRRIAYDEDHIREAAVVEGKEIYLRGKPDFTPFEICASLAVKLHNTLNPPTPGYKWLLARIEFRRPLMEEDLRGFRLELLQTIAGRFTKTEVGSAEERLGLLFFTLAPLEAA